MSNEQLENQTKNVLYEKAYQFAIRIVNAYKYLTNDKKEFVLAKQLLRSGTSIGAIISSQEINFYNNNNESYLT